LDIFAPQSLTAILLAFGVAASAILFAGIRLSGVADRLADRTGLGEALVGSVLLGAATSLSGLTTSVSAAWNGLPELAVSNCVGGIAGQTFFLAAADLAYRRANLEHAAASLENMIQGTVLMGCLALAVVATGMSGYDLWGLNPASYLLVLFYGLGLWVTRRATDNPSWEVQQTDETRTDNPKEDESGSASTRRLWGEFLALAGVVAAAGWLVSRAAEGAIEVTGVSQSIVGTYATALVTSLPELVTTVAAVRRGALTLAVGGIIGGNAFDVLFLTASDAAYREGSIYDAITDNQTFIIGLSLFMTAVLVMGLLRREKQGPAGIGFETVVLIAAYVLGGVVLFTGG
jgi:cation:H+ antiporter